MSEAAEYVKRSTTSSANIYSPRGKGQGRGVQIILNTTKKKKVGPTRKRRTEKI